MNEKEWTDEVKNIKMPNGMAEKVIKKYVDCQESKRHAFYLHKLSFASIAAVILIALFSSVTYIRVYASYVDKEITVFFDEGISADEISSIEYQIKAMPDVASITYVSGDEAWAAFKEKYLDGETANAFTENPLANSSNYIIKVRRSADFDKLEVKIMEIDGVRKIKDKE